MSTTKALAAAAVIGLAGSLLSLPALAIVSMGSDAAVSVQKLHQGTLLAAAKKKATKAKKATKEKKPPTKAKAKGKGKDKGAVTIPSAPGAY